VKIGYFSSAEGASWAVDELCTLDMSDLALRFKFACIFLNLRSI